MGATTPLDAEPASRNLRAGASVETAAVPDERRVLDPGSRNRHNRASAPARESRVAAESANAGSTARQSMERKQ